MISYATLKSMVNEFEFNTWWVIRSPAAHKSASISSNKYMVSYYNDDFDRYFGSNTDTLNR